MYVCIHRKCTRTQDIDFRISNNPVVLLLIYFRKGQFQSQRASIAVPVPLVSAASTEQQQQQLLSSSAAAAAAAAATTAATRSRGKVERQLTPHHRGCYSINSKSSNSIALENSLNVLKTDAKVRSYWLVVVVLN